MSFACQLKIDLDAIAHNWRVLSSRAGVPVAAVVKANAYGLGVERVAPALYAAGCRDFFVANLVEAEALRQILPPVSRVYVLQGCVPGDEARFASSNLTPVIISESMLRSWLGWQKDRSLFLSFALKLNSGMNRLGLRPEQVLSCLDEGLLAPGVGLTMLVSHLASADELDAKSNELQRKQFLKILSSLREIEADLVASLANSAGVLLGSDWCFDLPRAGIALYGGCDESACGSGGLKSVVSLLAPVLQLQDVKAGESVGYGGEWQASDDAVCAVLGLGYADGILRSWWPRGKVFYKAWCPVRGRVSMDSCVVDVSSLPPEQRPQEGELVEIFGKQQSLSMFAGDAQTISYEVLTRLGERLMRDYLPLMQAPDDKLLELDLPKSTSEDFPNG